MSVDPCARVREALTFINSDCDRETWYLVGMGVQDELGEDGWLLWDEWSAEAPSYDAATARDVWKSFKAGKGKGFGYVVNLAKESGFDPSLKGKGKTISKEALAEREAKNVARRAQHEVEEAQEAVEAAVKAKERWKLATPASPDHPYLKRKGIKPHGVRVGKWHKRDMLTGKLLTLENVLILPLWDRQRNIQMLQGITVTGDKLYQAGGDKKGNFFAIGSKPQLLDGVPVFHFAEGFATAASAHEATGHLTLCCFDAGNLVRVVRAVRERSPNAHLVILADNDTETEAAGKGNAGMKKATQVALETGARVAFISEGGDFNDLRLEQGDAAVLARIDAAVVPTGPYLSTVPVEAQALKVKQFKTGDQTSIHDVHQMDRVNEMSWPNMDLKPGAAKPLNTIPNLRHLLRNYGFTVRYDVIRKELKVTHPGQRGTRDNVKSKTIDTVLSLAALNYLPKTEIPSFMLSIGDENPVNPVMDFISAKPWDGISRLGELLSSIKTKAGFQHDLLELLLRRWLISAVAAAAKPEGFWSKGVLVFQGDQSLGKTAWFRALLPMAMRDLVKVDAHIDPKEKDTIISAVSHWLVELGELDGTMNKADTARLKGFISQDVDQFRRPYGRAEEKFQRRTVFFASVNPRQFLVDETGNVRWWTVPVISVNSDHGIDMQQIWAEACTWFEAGERWWLDSGEEARLNFANVDHEQSNPIDDLIGCKYNFQDPARRRLSATQVLLELGYSNPAKKLLNEAATVMRKQFGESTKSDGRRVFRVPHLIVSNHGY